MLREKMPNDKTADNKMPYVCTANGQNSKSDKQLTRQNRKHAKTANTKKQQHEKTANTRKQQSLKNSKH